VARIVGIDLGTTNSLVAVMRGERPEILTDPRSGAPLLPSAVSLLPDGTFLVGDSARRRAALHPRSSILSVKRFMGLGGEHVDDEDRRRHRFVATGGTLGIALEDGAGGAQTLSASSSAARSARSARR